MLATELKTYDLMHFCSKGSTYKKRNDQMFVDFLTINIGNLDYAKAVKLLEFNTPLKGFMRLSHKHNVSCSRCRQLIFNYAKDWNRKNKYINWERHHRFKLIQGE